MNPTNHNSPDFEGRERSATFGMQNENNFNINNHLQSSNQQNNQPTNFETFLSKYEFLRLNYENEGISQQALLMLRRLAKGFHEADPSLCNLPILKAMINVCKKLMLNDFEIMIWAIYLKETAFNRPDFIEYLDISAMFVKKDLNEPDVFKIFETFLAHNHYDTYARYASSSKPQVTLTLRRINFYHMTLLAPFEVQRDKEIQDFNYEVDALEDEHVRREVHTTKIVDKEESDSVIKQEPSDNSYTDNSTKNNKRTRKAKANVKPKQNKVQTPDSTRNIEEKVKPTSLQAKRDSKKSFEIYKDDYSNDDNSESPYPLPRFSPNIGLNPQLPKANPSKPPLLFSQIGARMKENPEKKEQNRFSFAATTTNLPPAIPPPFRKPVPSIESINELGGFGHLDDPMYYNKSMEKMPQTISREFMDRHNHDHHENKTTHNVFKSFTPFASGEFGMLFDNQNDMHRNLLHPTPKYQK